MREDTNIKGADTESDFWLIIYSVVKPIESLEKPIDKTGGWKNLVTVHRY